MKKVLFKKIEISNFLSVGNSPLELNFSEGITLITGDNRDKGGRNGVGKSSVIESLYWALFGNTIRDIKKDKIVHNQTGKNCIVSLYFDIKRSESTDSYIILRRAEPNKVELFCNGVDITRSSMPKTDEFIKELIGANEEVFQNAVIMTANNTTPFMAQKKVDKRKFVEGVLHLSVFGEMLLQVRSDLNEAKKNNEITSNSFLEKQKNLESFKRQHLKIEETKNQKIKLIKTKQLENINNINQISSLDSTTLDQNKNELEASNLKKDLKVKQLEALAIECQENYEILKSKELTLRISTEALVKEKNSLLSKTKTCPTCRRSYEDHDHDHIEKLIEELNFKIKNNNFENEQNCKKIKTHQKNCDTIQETISSIENQIKENKDEILKISLLAQNVKHLTEINKNLDIEIEEWINSPNEFDQIISETLEQIKEKELSLNELQKQIQILESAKFVVSEEGVKTYIIKKMLNLLNAKLNFYLQALEAPCKCEFNEMFEETIFNDKGMECSYFNFSGGERKRIDLAILFMFQDLLRVQTGTSFSLSMYDELFDSALDEKGVDKILTILKERVEKYNESVYIVSHNKTATKSGIDQVLLLEKVDGVTRLVQ